LKYNNEISLIICTHNRSRILEQTLPFYRHLIYDNPYEIIIVVNACTDNTLDIACAEAKLNSHIKVIQESNLGHSNARNKGWQSSQASFVFYLDDDAKPNANLLTILNSYLKNKNIHCISGKTVYWDLNSPKWILPKFVETPQFRDNFGLMPIKGFINGCACGFSVVALEEVGGFYSKYGMTGSKVGYYDEVHTQILIQNAGYDIYYSPNIIVHHQSHNKSVMEFLKSAYLKGKFGSHAGAKEKVMFFFNGCYYGIIGFLKIPLRLKRIGYKASIVECLSVSFTYFGKI